MSNSYGRAVLLAAFCLATWKMPRAQQAGTASQRPRLKMVVILSRHGVRSPTWAQSRLDSYSALPWPAWDVPPGNLTPRGSQLLIRLGSYDRASLAAMGLVPAAGCDGASSTYLWTDTDQRTVESGRALAEGLFPNCSLPVHTLAEGTSDPLFHSAAQGVKPKAADDAIAELSARLQGPANAQQAQRIEEIHHLLLGCPLPTLCATTRAPQNPLPTAITTVVRGKGDHIADLGGPLPLASSFAEDLLLQYADGMPMAQVGWGHVDEAAITRLVALHSDYFDLMHRTPGLARIEASNILSHIVRTLKQGANETPMEGAIGPSGSKIVVLVGHDTNLAGVAALLGLHWHLDGRADDTPPGTEMAFELWQDAHGANSIRITITTQSLRQMRDLAMLTLAMPPIRETLTPPACGAGPCLWGDFQRIADSVIDADAVFPMMQ